MEPSVEPEYSSDSSSSTEPIKTEPIQGIDVVATAIDALSGRKVPLLRTGGCNPESIYSQAIVHGIRHHPAFASSPAVLNICAGGESPQFTRARNARLIMSGEIPEFDMTKPETLPYCIWYPDVASQEQCKILAERYPLLRYNVGRACAVAGYADLFRSLDLLPDISIAEEARDNGNMAIFEAIVNCPVRYAVMDDYNRRINLENPSSPAFLNADTAVVSSLRRQTSILHLQVYGRKILDITEDSGIGEESSDDVVILPSAPEISLLYNPLPQDLPAFTSSKDLLIIMAAFNGDIDRYNRLRRPYMVENEIQCILRGIYHNTGFAKWWENEIVKEDLEISGRDASHITAAIAARLLMNNILYYTLWLPLDNLPYMIWYPQPPVEKTLRLLLDRRPQMKMQIAQACIAANYQSLYDEIQPQPHRFLWSQALQSPNLHYRQDLELRAEKDNISLLWYDEDPAIMKGQYSAYSRAFTQSEIMMTPWPDIRYLDKVSSGGPYDGLGVDMSSIDLYLSAPPWAQKFASEATQPVNILSIQVDHEEEEKRESQGQKEKE